MLLEESTLNDTLIAAAAQVLNPYTTQGGRLFGDVGAAVLSTSGKVYLGVCVDTSGWGLCAERSAVAAMITAGEYKVRTVVAVWRDARDQKLDVLPPCGICRDFMRNVDEDNLEADVILGRGKTAKLKDLLSFYQWPDPLDNDVTVKRE